MANDDSETAGSAPGLGDSRSPTVLDRMVAARIDIERARAWLESGLVRVDGVHVTDPDTPAPPPARVVCTAS